MTLRFVVPRASVCVCVCHCHSLCLCLSVSLRVCVAIFSIYILNINYVNSSALVFIIHNGPCAKVISTSVERIAICIHEHLLGSPAECCWPAIKQERVYNTHKEVGQGNLASDWPFWKAQFKKNIYIFPLDRCPSADRLQRYPTHLCARETFDLLIGFMFCKCLEIFVLFFFWRKFCNRRYIMHIMFAFPLKSFFFLCNSFALLF